MIEKQIYKCSYCKKEFKRERTLETHACESRRRVREKSKPANRIAYEAYKKFYRTMQGQSNKRHDEFIRSVYYLAFIRFGDYCINTRVISPARFTDHLIKQSVPIDKWCKDSTYKNFLPHFIQTEPYADAIERTILYSITWGQNNGKNFYDLFRYGSENRITQEIINGRISPWVLFNCDSAQRFLGALDDVHLEGMWNMIDSDKWDIILTNNQDDVKFVKSALRIGGW